MTNTQKSTQKRKSLKKVFLQKKSMILPSNGPPHGPDGPPNGPDGPPNDPDGPGTFIFLSTFKILVYDFFGLKTYICPLDTIFDAV